MCHHRLAGVQPFYTVLSSTKSTQPIYKHKRKNQQYPMTLSKLMVLCLFPFIAILGGFDITGFFNKAGLQARHISQTRKSKLRGGRRMQPRVSLTPNPKPQTRPSVKGLRLMDSPGPNEPLPSVESAGSRDSDPSRYVPAAIVQGGSRSI